MAREPRSERAPSAEITVGALLDMDCMAGAELLAGAAGLDRRIRGVNIIEVPDVWRWLRGGELLFSAGYPWRDDPSRLAGLVRDLDRIPVAAMAFKLGQYLRSLPDSMLETAEEIGFPVLRLPDDLAYRDVIEPVYARLAATREGVFDRSLEVKRKFTRFSLDDQSIDKVTGAFAEQIGHEVEVHNVLDETVYRAQPDGRVTTHPLAGSPLAGLRQAHRLGRNPRRLNTESGPVLATALILRHETHGWVVVKDPPPEPSPALESELAYATELVSFLLLTRLSLLEGRREAVNLFFRSLMSDSLSNEQAAERAITLGVRLTRPCAVLVVGTPESEDPDVVQRLRAAVERELAGTQRVVSDEFLQGRLIALLQTDEDGALEATSHAIEAAAARLGCSGVVVAAGSTRTGLEGVRRSKSEALVAYATARRMGMSGLVRFVDLRVERLLSQIPSADMMWSYVTSVIGGIQDQPELLHTLETYLQHGGNKVATAAAIPMHRSSLLYRLRKISEALDADLNDPERCMELWLALKLRQLLELSEPGGEAVRES